MFLLKGDCKKIIKDTTANGFPNIAKKLLLLTPANLKQCILLQNEIGFYK